MPLNPLSPLRGRFALRVFHNVFGREISAADPFSPLPPSRKMHAPDLLLHTNTHEHTDIHMHTTTTHIHIQGVF